MILRTAGDGHWSRKVADVPITKFEIAYLDENNLLDSTFGELRVFFDTRAWRYPDDGLIYTDSLFETLLKTYLVSVGFTQQAADSIGYSEQGMQGDDYVSLDIGQPFLRECDSFVNFATNQIKYINIQLNT